MFNNNRQGNLQNAGLEESGPGAWPGPPPGSAATSPTGEPGAKACTKLPLRADRTPRDGHINKAHKKYTNIKSYKH